jgi:hypothetical protein
VFRVRVDRQTRQTPVNTTECKRALTVLQLESAALNCHCHISLMEMWCLFPGRPRRVVAIKSSITHPLFLFILPTSLLLRRMVSIHNGPLRHSLRYSVRAFA